MKGLTPIMKFSRLADSAVRLRNYHTFGCPFYILNARLQDAGRVGPPKWEPLSHLGIYPGHSPSHAWNAALVLNPRTGLASSQLHVVKDDNFSTVPSLRSGTVADNWHQLVCNSREKSTDGFMTLKQLGYLLNMTSLMTVLQQPPILKLRYLLTLVQIQSLGGYWICWHYSREKFHQLSSS